MKFKEVFFTIIAAGLISFTAVILCNSTAVHL